MSNLEYKVHILDSIMIIWLGSGLWGICKVACELIEESLKENNLTTTFFFYNCLLIGMVGAKIAILEYDVKVLQKKK